MSSLQSLPLYGGPFDGREQPVLREARFFWFVRTPAPRLVANIGSLEYVDIEAAEGCYVRQTKSEGRSGKEILFYRPVPGRLAA